MPLSPEQQIYAAIDVYVSLCDSLLTADFHIQNVLNQNVRLCRTVLTSLKFCSAFVLLFQISQVMFHKLKKTEIEKESEAKKFIEEFGEAAYIATQKLL